MSASPDTHLRNANTDSASTPESTQHSRGRASARRGRGLRGRGRGRGRRGGRAGRSNASASSTFMEGWRVQSVQEPEIVMDSDFTKKVLSERARLFCRAALGRMDTELRATQLQPCRSSFVVLFCDSLVRQCTLWTNEKIVMTDSSQRAITRADMYSFLAIFFFSQCSGLSVEKTVEVMQRMDCPVPPLTLVRYLSSNILAYSFTGRGDGGEGVWSSQRDQTVSLSLLETTAFRTSLKLFLSPSFTFGTLDDDLYGTRANDNQVKMLSARKADKEGHCVDAIADALFRITFMVRFRRRGESQTENVEKLINSIVDERGESSLSGFVVTADRGYGKISMIPSLATRGVGFVFIMPQHLIRCHPFVARSHFQPDRDDVEDNESGNESDVSPSRIDHEAVSGVQFDRGTAFVIDDHPQLGLCCKYAQKTFKDPGKDLNVRVTAAAVRERGTNKFAKTLRFMYALPKCLSDLINCWVAVPKAASTAGLLFSRRQGDPSLTVPSDTSVDTRDVLQRHCLSNTAILTVDQRCSDWFILRQFRVTGTMSGRLLMRDPELLHRLGMQVSELPDRSVSESFEDLAKGWISSARSTEAMMRGTATESAALASIRKKDFVKGVLPCGMFGDNDQPWLACSPDGVALIDTQRTSFRSDGLTGESLHVCSVEIKTSVADSFLSHTIQNASVDLFCVEVGTPQFVNRIPQHHVGQIIQQLAVLHTQYGLYVTCSETALLSCTLIHCSESILLRARSILHTMGSRLLPWAYEPEPSLPQFVTGRTKTILKSILPMWRATDQHVKDNNPFVPLKLLKHGTQSFYSKTKGGVDGSAQARAMLRSPSASFKWEQKIVGQTFKTLFVNAFIAYRMHERRDVIEDPMRFQDIHSFRRCLNKVESLSDFCLEACSDLLRFAHSLQSSTENTHEDETFELVVGSEAHRLKLLAKSWKRNRLRLFNSTDGTKLRLHVPEHYQKQVRVVQWCSLCGMNVQTHNRFRGHRSAFKCTVCAVHLCVRTHDGFRRSCWDIWHSTKRLQPRQTNSSRFPSRQSSQGSSDGAGSSQEEPSQTGQAGTRRASSSSDGRPRRSIRLRQG